MPPKSKKIIENDKNTKNEKDNKTIGKGKGKEKEKDKGKEKEKEKNTVRSNDKKKEETQPQKKQKKEVSDNDSDDSNNSESDQSTLSDTEYLKKEDKILQGGEDDDILDGFDDKDDNENDEDENDDNEDEDDDDKDKDEDDDKEEKESIQKNENENEMKDDEEDIDCVYHPNKKGISYDEEYEDNEDHFIEDDENQLETKYISDEERITTRRLTKYERVNIIGTRAKQIELGAQKMVKNTKGLNPRQIAKLELEMKACPIIIKRQLPSGAIELVDVNTLEMFD